MTKTQEKFGTLEVARMLGVSAMTVVRWIDNGLIPAFRTPGKHRRILRADLRHFVGRMGFPIPTELSRDRASILAVDDEADVLDVFRRAFSGNNHDEFEVHCASDGVTALIEVGRIKPDVILLDIILPGINGVEVCRRIKENNYLSSIIIAISGKATVNKRQEILEAGADRFMEKPVSIHELRRVVRELLSG